MANRYWVPSGGNASGTWDASSTANWSTTSGGAGGASAPTSADDVFFDAGSDAGGIFTVTIGTGAVCRDITAGSLDFVMTLAGSAALGIYGSLIFPATNFTRTYTGLITFAATTTGKTITTNGVSLASALTFYGVGGFWTLSGALTTSGIIRLTNGTFDVSASNYSITCGGWAKTGGTFNEQAGTLTLTSASPSLTGGNDTYYDVLFSSTNVGTAVIVITGANTFNNLTFTSSAATGIRNISIGANQTVNGTLTLGTANTAIRRMFMFSNVIGTPYTITAAAIATLADVDFRDIVAAGASGTWAGTRLGNCLGNSNITFDAGKTVYRIAAGNWSATQWALSSGGAVDINNFPLAQDTAIFDANSTTGTVSYDTAWNTGSIDFSALSVPVTVSIGTITPFYKNLTLDADVTWSGTGQLIFAGQGIIQNIITAGKTITQRTIINSPTGTVRLLDSLTNNADRVELLSGTLDLNNFDLTAATFTSSNTNTRAIAFGTGEINLTGNNTTVWGCATLTNFSYTGTSTVNLTYSGSTGTRTAFNGNAAGATESNVVNFNITNGTDIIDIRGSTNNYNYTGFSGSIAAAGVSVIVYGDTIFSLGLTYPSSTNATIFSKSSGTQTVTSNGKTLDNPITKSGAGTLQLLDNLNQGSTCAFTLTAGSIDLNGNDLTVGTMSTTGATARSINHGIGGDLHVLGATFTASGSNLTTSGTGSISMDSASSKTFAGGGFTYQKLNQGGAGTLVITGANTFADITNTVQPCQINFPASVTTTVSDLSVNGTAGNLVKLRSSISGTRANIVVV